MYRHPLHGLLMLRLPRPKIASISDLGRRRGQYGEAGEARARRRGDRGRRGEGKEGGSEETEHEGEGDLAEGGLQLGEVSQDRCRSFG